MHNKCVCGMQLFRHWNLNGTATVVKNPPTAAAHELIIFAILSSSAAQLGRVSLIRGIYITFEPLSQRS